MLNVSIRTSAEAQSPTGWRWRCRKALSESVLKLVFVVGVGNGVVDDVEASGTAVATVGVTNRRTTKEDGHRQLPTSFAKMPQVKMTNSAWLQRRGTADPPLYRKGERLASNPKPVDAASMSSKCFPTEANIGEGLCAPSSAALLSDRAMPRASST